jgi:hypothetical protein
MGKVRYKVVEHNGQEIVQEIHKIVFHRIDMGDCEDPDIMVADPIWKWQQTDPGKFVMENAIPKSPEWVRNVNPMTYGHTYLIIAEMEVKKLAEYYLKWGKPNVRND